MSNLSHRERVVPINAIVVNNSLKKKKEKRKKFLAFAYLWLVAEEGKRKGRRRKGLWFLFYFMWIYRLGLQFQIWDWEGEIKRQKNGTKWQNNLSLTGDELTKSSFFIFLKLWLEPWDPVIVFKFGQFHWIFCAERASVELKDPS